MNKNSIKKVLIYNPFGIGDVIFSTPMLMVLAKNIPGVNISYICNTRTYWILKNNPYVNDIIVYEKDHFRQLAENSKPRFLKKLILFFKKIKSINADALIDLSLNYQASLAAKFMRIPKRIGFNYRGRGRFLTDKIDLDGFEKKHVVFYYMDLLKLLGLEANSKVFTEVFVSGEDEKWSDESIKKNNLCGKIILGLIPGGGKSWGINARYRRWPVSNFAHVAGKVIDNFNYSIILFGDIAEIDLCSNIESFIHHKVINMCGKTTIGQLLALMKKCSMILCNEGGPLHIAVALGVPTVSIFGPVDEKIYGPYSEDNGKHIVINSETKCRPCYSKFKHNECTNVACLNSISEDEVFGAIKKLSEAIKIGRI